MRKYLLAVIVLATAFLAAATVIQISQLTLEQRLHGLPGSTLVRAGKMTLTLDQLRAAHNARVLNLKQASATGSNVKQQLAAHPFVVSAPAGAHVFTPAPTPAATGLKLKSSPHGFTPGPLQTATPHPAPVINLSGLSKLGVIEPPSQYATAPADMKAFCQNAWASVCLYLPPDQQGLFALPQRNDIVDFDPLVDQGQCASEGGSWIGAGCNYFYPRSYLMHFTPPSNYQVPTAVQCDANIWNYTIDEHGAVSVGVKPSLISESNWFNTGHTPWCVIHVYPAS